MGQGKAAGSSPGVNFVRGLCNHACHQPRGKMATKSKKSKPTPQNPLQMSILYSRDVVVAGRSLDGVTTAIRIVSKEDLVHGAKTTFAVKQKQSTVADKALPSLKTGRLVYENTVEASWDPELVMAAFDAKFIKDLAGAADGTVMVHGVWGLPKNHQRFVGWEVYNREGHLVAHEVGPVAEGDEEEIPSIIAHSDALFIASGRQPTGENLLESRAFRLPVIPLAAAPSEEEEEPVTLHPDRLSVYEFLLKFNGVPSVPSKAVFRGANPETVLGAINDVTGAMKVRLPR